MGLVVKRHGRKHKFDERKIYASCYAAFVNTQVPKEKAENGCERTCRELKKWAKTKKEVTSDEIFKKTISVLKKINKDVAFMYETHRDLS